MTSTRNRMATGCLRKRGNVYWCQWKYRGKPYGRSLGARKKSVAETKKQNLMASVRTAIANGCFYEEFDPNNRPYEPKGDIEISKAWDYYLKAVNKPDTGESTLKQYSYQFNRFTDWIFANHPNIEFISQVTKPVARGFLQSISDHLTPNTYNKYVRLLHLVFRVINDNLEIDRNPFGGAGRKRLNGSTESKRPVTDEELSIILHNAEGEWLTLLLIGVHTGFRLGDACLMEVSSLNLKTRRIQCRIRKTGRVVSLYIHDELYEHLQTITGLKKQRYVCPDLAQLYLQDEGATLSKRLQQFLKNCGIEIHLSEKRNGRRVPVVGYHSLRHRFVSMAAKIGIDRATVQAIVGWGSPMMEKVYTHVDEEHLDKPIKNAPRVLNKGKKKPGSPYQSMRDDELRKTCEAMMKELERRKSS